MDRTARSRGSPYDTDSECRSHLELIIGELASIAVALSGGVDSSLLLAVARRQVGEGAVAAIGVSPSLADRDLRLAREIATHLGSPLLEISTDELSIPGYVANAGNRCFHCKSVLYQHLGSHPLLANRTVCDGTHSEDHAGDRPGMRAAWERGVRSPLREAGLGKRAIREWAREIGLPNWDRPARPCLASRIGIGTPVSVARLHVVESLEEILAEAGFRVFRARMIDDEVVVEVGVDELDRLGEPEWRRRFLARARDLGVGEVSVERRGYGVVGPSRRIELRG